MDLEAARWMAAKLRSSTGNFIWINKMGAHFPYASRYPLMRRFAASARKCGIRSGNRSELVNSYDNAVNYNLENFFRFSSSRKF